MTYVLCYNVTWYFKQIVHKIDGIRGNKMAIKELESLKVSIIMPAYNVSRHIEKTVNTVIRQTHTNWELLIVDDCSTDNTVEMIQDLHKTDSRINMYERETNSGAAVARNKAIEQAPGAYLAFLDSDDLWMPDKLSLQIDFMKKNKVAFSATGYELISEDGTSKGIALLPPQKTNYDKMLRLSCPVGNLTVMYDRRIIGDQQVPAIKKRNDFALWLQTLHKTDACYGMPNVLGKYRVRKSSISRNKLTLLSYHWDLYYHIEKLGVVKSVWYICCWVFIKGTKIGIKRVGLKQNSKTDIVDSGLDYE